jgi:hypothetical protein
MVDSNNQRPHRAYDPHEQAGASDETQRAAGNDPLAELARLIGQSDPFADFERRVGADAQRGAQAWSPEPAPVPPPPAMHPEAYPQAAAPESYAAVAAELQGGAPHAYAEQFPEGTYTPYPEQAAYPEQVALDPAQAGYEYPPEGYPQGYDPYYGDDEALDEAEFHAQQEQQRGRRRLAAVIAILSLAVFGGAAAYGYRTLVGSGTHASPPPVIKADTTPTKVKPTAQARDSASNKLIYDRVGERSQTAERVVPREEKPVDIRAAAVAQPRAVYPGPREGATTVSSPTTVPVIGRSTSGQVLPVATAPSIGQASGAILPSAKKVRTVTIRPDMTVVPRSAESNSEPEPTPQAEPAQAPPPRTVASVPAAPALTQSAPPQRSTSAPLSLSPNAAPQAAPAPRAPARSAEQPLALASVPPAGSNSAGTEAASGGKFAVQVSSQRSEAEANAAYRTLQSRYPNVLSGRSSFVRRADLGSRGVYYRTMVGPFATGEQASQLCSSLKAAGGQCIIHRN